MPLCSTKRRTTTKKKTKRRTTTNLKTKNQNCQKIKLYGSPTSKDLKKHLFRLIGGAERLYCKAAAGGPTYVCR